MVGRGGSGEGEGVATRNTALWLALAAEGSAQRAPAMVSGGLGPFGQPSSSMSGYAQQPGPDSPACASGATVCRFATTEA